MSLECLDHLASINFHELYDIVIHANQHVFGVSTNCEGRAFDFVHVELPDLLERREIVNNDMSVVELDEALAIR
jgi:hypothetical protein